MFDPNTEIVSKVAVNIITEVFKSCFSGLREAEAWVKDKSKEYDPLHKAARKYAERFEARYNSMRIFGMSNPVPLRNIYTRVNVLEKITARYRTTIQEMEKQYNRDLRSFGHVQKTKDGIHAVNHLDKIILLGKPGAGKTTFLKYIAFQALDGVLNKQRIPVFIRLKDWSDSNVSLINFIIGQFDICGFPSAGPFVERILNKGKMLLLLDGLDEVTSDLRDVISQMIILSEKYNKNQIIISCRIAAYNYCFEKFTDIEIADFSDQQIETFIGNWFGHQTPKAVLCLQKIKSSKQIKELANIPLLLTLLCLAFDETMDFPTNRAELYKEASDALLKKWDASRDIKRPELYRYLSLKRKESLFARIAADAFEKGLHFLPQHVIERQIASFIQNLQEAKQDTIEPDSEAILKSIEAQHGILVERAKGIYSFSHLTFQEYFTARYIVDNAVNRTLEGLVARHLTDDNWREVILLTAVMLEEADKLFELMLDKVREDGYYAFGPYLKKISKEMVKKGSPYSPSASLVLAISYVIWRSPDAADQDKAISIQLACALDPLVESDIKRDLEKTFRNAVFRHSDQALRLFSSTELKRIYEYFKASHLLIDCLNTDCYVTRETRERIYQTLHIPLEAAADA